MNERIFRGILSIVVSTGVISPACASQLLLNPSFETPVIGTTTCNGAHNAQCFNLGDSIGGWTVVGPGAAVGKFPIANLTSAFTDGSGDHYTAEQGNQSLDLTGSANQGANGVEQTVVTVPGTTYALSFFIGNEDNNLSGFGLNSSVKLLVDGVSQGTFFSSGNVTDNVSWAGFTLDFVAAAASMTIDFINATPVSDIYAGLDNVTLTSVDQPVDLPEPNSYGVMALGAALLFLWRYSKPGSAAATSKLP